MSNSEYVLVPREPTEAMLKEPRHGISEDVRRAIWSAMLAASPPSPAREAPSERDVGEVERVAQLCRDRAAGYGALRQSSLTAIALDRAADLLALTPEAPAPAPSAPPTSDTAVKRMARAMCDRVNGQGDYDENPERHSGWDAQAMAGLAALSPQPAGRAGADLSDGGA